MAIITTRNGPPRKKPFAWSFSRMKNFEVCPKRYYEIDILKNYREPAEPGGPLDWGDKVHVAMAARCGPNRVPLPEGMAQFEHWAKKILGDSPPENILVEQDMAIDANFGACEWFGDTAWYRAKGDLIKIHGPVALLVDWKTGKILEDSFQLALLAACVFARYPAVMAVRCAFVWLKEDAESSENFLRQDMPRMWRSLWPRIEALKSAHEHSNFPPIPCKMCRAWCAVKACPNNGKTFP